MSRNIFLITALVFTLVSCAKKEKASVETPQDFLNQSVQTQTELTQMQGKTEKAVPEQPQPSVTTEAPQQATLPQTASEQPTDEEIQQALKNANFYSGKVDGNIGPKTKKAIRNFQEKNSLKIDGKVGAKTWAKLQTYLQQPSAPATEAHD